MKRHVSPSVLVVALAALWVLAAPAVQTQDKPIQIPQPGVAEVMTIEGKFIRAAYNNEGYVILGYEAANRSLGDPWILIDVGMTLREGVQAYDLTRAAVSLDTPGGKTVPLPSVQEYRQVNLNAVQARANVQRGSINYFPPKATMACAILFFPDLENRAMPNNQVELSDNRACVGRFYFAVPGGITHGQYWLNVKFANSLVRVPFKILTKEEEEFLGDNFKDIRKQVQDAFRKR